MNCFSIKIVLWFQNIPVFISTVNFTSPDVHVVPELLGSNMVLDGETVGRLGLGLCDGVAVVGFSVGFLEGRLLGLRVGFEEGSDVLLIELLLSNTREPVFEFELLLFALTDSHRLFVPHLPEQQKTSELPALKHNSPAG